jgi:hypothetical protein
MICDRCNGTQEVKIYENSQFYIMEKCYNCDGKGEIDWISNIFKKEQNVVKSDYLNLLTFPENITYEDAVNMRIVYKYRKNLYIF